MKRKLKGLLIFVGFVFLLFAYFFYRVTVTPPAIKIQEGQIQDSLVHDGNIVTYGNSWIKQNEYGIWEMFIEGKPYDRGIAFGKLAENLIAEKEKAFINEIQHRIPSALHFTFLKYLVAWFNRDLEQNIPKEFQEEIYGASLFMSDAYDDIAPKFHRSLNYHAAHDIGHAMQNLNMVGCTSFASKTTDSTGTEKLIIGRNFDFYFGDDFAKDKIVAFVQPDSGYNFVSVTWAGFSGVVSGMNDQGLTVTLNSAKTGITWKAKTPVSIIGRHILQYASTIEEAYAIASSYDSFVSETFLIGSAKENNMAVIEKSQDSITVYYPPGKRLIVTNHFQSEALNNEPSNTEYLEEGVSQYRYERVNELLDEFETIHPKDAAFILRDRNGLGARDIGQGNEKAINQLIAHHSVIFIPDELKMWVSAPPFQLGKYVCYDLNNVFNKNKFPEADLPLFFDSLSIPEDPFLLTDDYKNYCEFRQIATKIQDILYYNSKDSISTDEAIAFIHSNPDHYLSYYYLGDYYLKNKEYEKAAGILEIGLTKEIARKAELEHMENSLSECKKALNP